MRQQISYTVLGTLINIYDNTLFPEILHARGENYFKLISCTSAMEFRIKMILAYVTKTRDSVVVANVVYKDKERMDSFF
jgi:hypothetical protein